MSVSEEGLCWDLVVDGPRTGEANMARDLELARQAAAGVRRPTLRLYAWDPPAVSVGKNQPLEQACDLEACQELGWDVVRRPTGGRAVLHARDEVTYAVAMPLAMAPEGVLAAYAWLAEGLVAAYRLLGVDAALASGRHLESRSGACFDAPATHELVAGGRKIAGSAQVRRAGYLLQHGSLPLTFDAGLHARLLGLDARAAAILARRAVGLGDLLSPPPQRARVLEALAAGFEQALGIRFANTGGHPGGGASGGGPGDSRAQSRPVGAA